MYTCSAEMSKYNFIILEMSSYKKFKKGQAVTVDPESAYEKALEYELSEKVYVTPKFFKFLDMKARQYRVK